MSENLIPLIYKRANGTIVLQLLPDPNNKPIESLVNDLALPAALPATPQSTLSIALPTLPATPPVETAANTKDDEPDELLTPIRINLAFQA